MPLIILAAVLAILVYLPSLWVRRVMAKHGAELSQLPGTGGELASHLIKRFKLDGIQVEETGPLQDHFDPSAQKVRLSPTNFSGKSLTAIAVAAHEAGHAMQFHRNEKIFELRKRYLPMASALSKAGIGLMMVLPFIGFLVRAPLVI